MKIEVRLSGAGGQWVIPASIIGVRRMGKIGMKRP
jgi:hypothetical protein